MDQKDVKFLKKPKTCFIRVKNKIKKNRFFSVALKKLKCFLDNYHDNDKEHSKDQL